MKKCSIVSLTILLMVTVSLMLSCSRSPKWLNGTWVSEDIETYGPVTVWFNNGRYRVEDYDGEISAQKKLKIVKVTDNFGDKRQYFHDYVFYLDPEYPTFYYYDGDIPWRFIKVSNIEPVDIGLKVKWGNMNLGATTPDDYGFYFAWGETSRKKEFTEDNYKLYVPDENGNRKMIKKYFKFRK